MDEKKTEGIILTGMMRSGTTFLQKIINTHAKFNIGEQTETMTFLDEKSAFLKQLGIERYHLLSHYNSLGHYPLMSFLEWLFTSSEKDFSVRLKSQLNNGTSANFNGVKEVMIEEFLPYLVKRGFKCIIIVRDPRDVLTSLSFGRQGQEFTGKRRPVLFDLRNWRKSIQISKMIENEKNFKLVKFEDLISKKHEIINEIFTFLGEESLCISDFKIELENSLKTWEGNSSFYKREIFDKKAIGMYETVMPNNVIEYIESTCLDEMQYAGYSCREVSDKKRVSIISKYMDSFEIDRPEFDNDYSSSVENVQYESNRVYSRIVKL